MKHTVIVCSSNRAVQEKTRHGIETLVNAGAELVWQTGSADVAFARNMALTGALRHIATRNKAAAAPKPSSFALQYDPGGVTNPPDPLDTILMVDDDMEFTLAQAQELVNHSRREGVAASAMYATTLGTLAATRLYTPPGNQQRWLVGLGFLAIPLAVLQDVARRSEIFESHGEERVEFCWTAAYDGSWCAEDYTLCRRLGGVHLLPMGVGHLKVLPVYPDDHTIALIRDNKRLPGDTEAKVLQRIDEPAMLAALKAKDSPEAAVKMLEAKSAKKAKA